LARRGVGYTDAVSNRLEPSASHPVSYSPRLRVRLMAVTAAALMAVTGAACGSDDDDDMDDGVDQTEVTSASGSVVPGQPAEPVNTDPLNSQVTPTQAP
jgi:hypothetical protein